jgi:hypothetical protein
MWQIKILSETFYQLKNTSGCQVQILNLSIVRLTSEPVYPVLKTEYLI